ncbi:MAG: maleylpyruvate isomerase family mycothiol-dependent enzyme, partial [Actinobacteria bacterium]|nr:maleylpyruvate isomerase family mycothiol-dependent enzyme [Actinomycetota bacterium]
MDTLQSREEITEAFRGVLARFSNLVRPLTAEQLATPSRCEGWTVGDVAGHFVGSIAEIAAGDLDGQGTPPVTKRQVEDRRGLTGAELADELDAATIQLGGLLDVLDDNAWNAPAGGGFDGSLGRGVEALLFDGAVHADDIDNELGLDHHPTEAEIVA